MKHFFIITNDPKDKNMEVTNRIQQFIESHNKKCSIYEKEQEVIDSYTNPDKIPSDVDCILVLGGDGTLLQAARDTLELDVPLLGVNLGTLGYLAEVDISNLENALENLVNDEFEIEPRMMLRGDIRQLGKSASQTYALNDIVVSRYGSLQVIHFHIYVNGQFLKGYSADGIIVSTPTGSTGYNMSAGGPIVEPKAKLMVITPICPHTLNTRSIVLSPEDIVEIEIGQGKAGNIQEVEVNFDGNHSVKLSTGDRIKITKSEKETKIIKLNKVSFLEVLHKKMSES